MPFPNLGKSVERFLNRKGKTITIINRRLSGKKDKYNDPDEVERPIKTDKWYLNRSSDFGLLTDSSGRKHTAQARLFLPGSVEIYDGLESDDRQASEVIIDNERWRVMRIDPQADGQVLVAFVRSQEIIEGDE